eukprot:s2689_g2.t1
MPQGSGESLVKEVAALQEELAALSELLFCSGILCEGRFRAQLHRRRFRRVLARFPLEAEGDLVNLQIAMNSRDIAASVFAFVGFPVSGFRAGSKTLSKSATPAELKASSVGRLFVVGGESNGQYLASAEVFNPDLDRWEDVPPMPSPRSFGAAASLRGKLYICGGSDGLQVTQRVVAYAPSSEEWTEMPAMVHRREGCGAASCNGLLVVAGGGDGVDLHISSECLNPESGGCWMLLPNMEEARIGCAAVSLNGQVYVCGGCGRRGSLAIVDRYNSAEGQWEAVRPMRDARERFAAAVVHGFIYVCGGWLYGDPSARGYGHNKSVHSPFNLGSELQTQNCPGPRAAHSCDIIDGRLYLFGGWNGKRALNDLHVLDVASGTWSEVLPSGSAPSARNNHTTAVVDSRLVVHGGHDGNKWVADMHILETSPQSGVSKFEGLVWHKAPTSGTPPSARACHTLTRLAHKLYMFGGYDGAKCFNDMDIIDLETMTWMQPALSGTLPQARNAHTMTVISTKLYLFGGHSGNKHLTDLHIFDTQKLHWSQPDILGTPPPGLRGHTANLIGWALRLFPPVFKMLGSPRPINPPPKKK